MRLAKLKIVKRKQNQLNGGGRGSRSKSVADHQLPVHFYNQCTTKKIDLENESQDHRVLQWQWTYSIANINLYKSHT